MPARAQDTQKMPSRSPPRGRPRSRSLYTDVSQPDSRSPSRPRRTVSPRSLSRSPRRSGRYRSETRSRSRSISPVVRSTKVCSSKLDSIGTNGSRSLLRNLPKTLMKITFERYSVHMDKFETWICP